MKTALHYFLVLSLIVLVSSTTVQVMTVKPTRPIAVHRDWYVSRWTLESAIDKYHKAGYTVKALTEDSSSTFYLVMEKY